MKKFTSLICLFCFMGIALPTQAITVKASTTSIPIAVNKTTTSKNAVAGGKIQASIEEDIIINSKTVFQKGDRATLNVLTAKKAGFVGIPGELLISGGDVFDTKGNPHKIEFSHQVIGEEKTWPKVMVGCGVFIILAPLAFFGFVKGGQAEIYPTQTLNVKLTNDFDF